MRAGGHGEGPNPSMFPLAEHRRGPVAARESIIYSLRLNQRLAVSTQLPSLSADGFRRFGRFLSCADGRDLLASTPPTLTADKSDYASWLSLPLREHR